MARQFLTEIAGASPDSDLLIDHLANDPTAGQLLAALAPSGLAMSESNFLEVFQGILRAPNLSAAGAQFQALAASMAILPVSVPVARRCAALREQLRLQGERVQSRALDLLVVAAALEHGLILATRNRHDYADIPGLVTL